jgi:hypothetical protein
MDPITILVTALVAGAAAGLKPTAEQAVKDAYGALKALIRRKYAAAAASVEHLEAAPDSKPQRDVVKEDLSKAHAAQDNELLGAARAVLTAVQAHDPGSAQAVGIAFEELSAASLNVSDVQAAGDDSATAVSIRHADIAGPVEIHGVKATAGTKVGQRQEAFTPAPAKIRILFLEANPSDTTRLRLDEEVRGIDRALRIAEYRHAFKPERAHAVRAGDLQELLVRHEPHIMAAIAGEATRASTKATVPPPSVPASASIARSARHATCGGGRDRARVTLMAEGSTSIERVPHLVREGVE